MSLAAHCMSCSWEEFGEHCQGSQAPPAQTCSELLAWRLLCPLRFVFVEESTVLGDFSKHCVTLEAAQSGGNAVLVVALCAAPQIFELPG